MKLQHRGHKPTSRPPPPPPSRPSPPQIVTFVLSKPTPMAIPQNVTSRQVEHNIPERIQESGRGLQGMGLSHPHVRNLFAPPPSSHRRPCQPVPRPYMRTYFLLTLHSGSPFSDPLPSSKVLSLLLYHVSSPLPPPLFFDRLYFCLALVLWYAGTMVQCHFVRLYLHSIVARAFPAWARISVCALPCISYASKRVLVSWILTHHCANCNATPRCDAPMNEDLGSRLCLCLCLCFSLLIVLFFSWACACRSQGV